MRQFLNPLSFKTRLTALEPAKALCLNYRKMLRQIETLSDKPEPTTELLSNLVFEDFGSCGDLVGFGGFNSVFECDARDDFSEIVEAA